MKVFWIDGHGEAREAMAKAMFHDVEDRLFAVVPSRRNYYGGPDRDWQAIQPVFVLPQQKG